MLIYTLFIILGYNKSFLDWLSKWVGDKWIKRLIGFYRVYSKYTIIITSNNIIINLV
jgi:hypothetical protein